MPALIVVPPAYVLAEPLAKMSVPEPSFTRPRMLPLGLAIELPKVKPFAPAYRGRGRSRSRSRRPRRPGTGQGLHVRGGERVRAADGQRERGAGADK